MFTWMVSRVLHLCPVLSGADELKVSVCIDFELLTKADP